MPKTFLVRKRSCVRKLWTSVIFDTDEDTRISDKAKRSCGPIGIKFPISLLSKSDPTEENNKQHDLQTRPLQSTKNKDDGSPENATSPVSFPPVLEASMADVRRSHQDCAISKQKGCMHYSQRPGFIPLNLSNLTHPRIVCTSPAVPKSPFLPQISPSMPTGSLSYTSKGSLGSFRKYGNSYMGSLDEDISDVFKLHEGFQSLKGNNSHTNRNFMKPSVLMLSPEADCITDDKTQDKLFINNSSKPCAGTQATPNTEHTIQYLKPILGGRVEVINGGYGIKNPLLSNDLHIQPFSAEHFSVERGNKEAKLTCKICGRYFEFPKLLQRHLKGHGDVKRYLCMFCGKGFNDTFDLKRHTRTHTGVRPYKCTLCDKAFTQRCSLESHCRKIHGIEYNFGYKERREKVYVCEECGHVTQDPEQHFMHIKDSHPYSTTLLRFYDKRQFKFGDEKSVLAV